MTVLDKVALGAVLACLTCAEVSARESVFFIGAHPDDFEACCGLALRMKDDFDVREQTDGSASNCADIVWSVMNER